MKYIKLFELFAIPEDEITLIIHSQLLDSVYGSHDDDGQTEDVIEFSKNKWDPFTNKEINEISNILNSRIHVRNGSSNCVVVCNYNSSRFNIFKLKDEWYYIEIYMRMFGSEPSDSVCYRCDQFTALMKCLKLIKEQYSW